MTSRTLLSPVDYDSLRTTGVILAAIMSVSGIVIALSKWPPKTTSSPLLKCTLHRVTDLLSLKQVKNVQNV